MPYPAKSRNPGKRIFTPLGIACVTENIHTFELLNQKYITSHQKRTMNRLSKKLFYVISLASLCCFLQAQSLDQAKKLYNEGQYAEAKPALEKLVKQAPSNPSYNLWYGVCCYETGDIEGAEKYLKVAVKRKVMDAYRYLADIYYRTYRFDEAAEMLEDHIDLLTKKKQDTQASEDRLSLVEDALRMMEKTEDVQIIDSMVVKKNDFLSAYTLSEESGTLTSFKDFFQSNESVSSSVYMNQKGDKIYYAHTADSGKYCLFSQSKLIDKWGDEKQLTIGSDTGVDNNYPFVMTDGVTIYYASTGNNSIGGYDLFVTRYNIKSDTYLAPEQLGMPFNSPFNDYMIVYDETKGLGWFVSDRFQPEGKVCVYLFIPNNEHNRVTSEDIEVKRSRAAVFSIKDSWKQGSNYSNLVELSHKEIPFGEVKVKKDFEFVINNNLTYYRLSEIKSTDAKNTYSKVVAMNKQIKELSGKLADMRVAYSSGNNTKKEQLKSSILEAETRLDELSDQVEDLEKKARNAEINYLKKK